MNTYIRVSPQDEILETIHTTETLDCIGRDSAVAKKKPVLLKVTSTTVPTFDAATQRLGDPVYTLKNKTCTVTQEVIDLTTEEIEARANDALRFRLLKDEAMAAWRLAEELAAVVLGDAEDISVEAKERLEERRQAREAGLL